MISSELQNLSIKTYCENIIDSSVRFDCDRSLLLQNFTYYRLVTVTSWLRELEAIISLSFLPLTLNFLVLYMYVTPLVLQIKFNVDAIALLQACILVKMPQYWTILRENNTHKMIHKLQNYISLIRSYSYFGSGLKS